MPRDDLQSTYRGLVRATRESGREASRATREFATFHSHLTSLRKGVSRLGDGVGKLLIAGAAAAKAAETALAAERKRVSASGAPSERLNEGAGISEALLGTGAEVLGKASEVLEGLGQAFGVLKGKVEEFGRSAEQSVGKIGEEIVRVFTGDALSNAVSEGLGKMSEALTDLIFKGKAGLDEFGQLARGIGEQIAGDLIGEVLSNASVKGFEEASAALRDFLSKGKAGLDEIGQFAQRIGLQIARALIQQNVVNPLVQGAQNFIRGIINPSLPADPTSSSVNGWYEHSGGVVGKDRAPSAYFRPSVFSGAPRLHAGGVVGDIRPDEVPIIARRGEGVFTPEQMRALAPAGGVQINFENRGTPQREVSRDAQFDGRGWVINVVTEDIDEGGSVFRAITRTTGARGAV